MFKLNLKKMQRILLWKGFYRNVLNTSVKQNIFFCHIFEMNNTINCKESYMIYENYIKQSIKLVELSLIEIIF